MKRGGILERVGVLPWKGGFLGGRLHVPRPVAGACPPRNSRQFLGFSWGGGLGALGVL